MSVTRSPFAPGAQVAGWTVSLPPTPPEERRRIAFVVHKFPPESVGGTEIYTWSLARELAHAGHDIHIFYPTPDLTPGDEQIERQGVHLWRVSLPDSRTHEDPVRQYWHTFRETAFEHRFSQFLAEVQPDIVHFQHVQGVSARLIELAQGYTRVVTLHDYWYFCANSQLIRPDHTPCNGPSTGCMNCVDCATERADLQWMRSLRPLVALPFVYRNRYLRRVVETVDLFIAPSSFLRDQYVRHGFPPQRIAVLENGLDDRKLVQRATIPLPDPPARPHFGFLGSLAWQKGVHVLVEAFNRLGDNASLTIYGSEQTFPDYVEQLKSLAHHPNIRFAGLLQPQQVGAALPDGLSRGSLSLVRELAAGDSRGLRCRHAGGGQSSGRIDRKSGGGSHGPALYSRGCRCPGVSPGPHRRCPQLPARDVAHDSPGPGDGGTCGPAAGNLRPDP